MTQYKMECTFSKFEEACKKYPANTALIYLGDSYTYSQLNDYTLRFASGLFNMGVRPGEKVMLYLPNCPQWVIANFAINKIGAVVVPVSPIYTTYEIDYIIRDSSIETVICFDTNFVYIRELLSSTNVKRVIVTSITEMVKPWKKIIGHLFDKIPNGKIEKRKEVFSFKEIIKNSKPEPPSIDIDPMEDLAYIMYTGGTTGFPKGVSGNHMGEVSYINDITYDVVNGQVLEGSDVVIMVNPLFHIMAKGYALGLGFNIGNTVVLMPVPEIDPILHYIEMYKVRWMLGVPALYRMILESDRLEQYDLSSLKYCYCGGDVLPREVFNIWMEKFSIPIYQVYGSTEVGHVSYSLLDRKPTPQTVGTPLRSRECIIVSPDTLEPRPSGEAGELLVTSEYTTKSYWNKPEETERSFVELNGKIFYRMGDIMTMNKDGELEFVERAADIIKYKGYRISASEIEAVLQDHHAVIGACAVGIPDDRCGERIKAIVIMKQDVKGVGSTELIKWCKEKLAPYKIPSYIEFRDMLPKSKVGKLLRREIRDEEKRKMDKKQDGGS